MTALKVFYTVILLPSRLGAGINFVVVVGTVLVVVVVVVVVVDELDLVELVVGAVVVVVLDVAGSVDINSVVSSAY